MYHIVEFTDTGDTEVVPDQWVRDERAVWPPYKERQRCDKAIMKAHPPGASWESFAIRIRATKGKNLT